MYILIIALLVLFENEIFLFIYLNLDKHPYWNTVSSERTTIEDVPQLEYDEHHIDLIADRGN